MTRGARCVYHREPHLYGVMQVTKQRLGGRVEVLTSYGFEQFHASELRSPTVPELQGAIGGLTPRIGHSQYARSALLEDF